MSNLGIPGNTITGSTWSQWPEKHHHQIMGICSSKWNATMGGKIWTMSPMSFWFCTLAFLWLFFSETGWSVMKTPHTDSLFITRYYFLNIENSIDGCVKNDSKTCNCWDNINIHYSYVRLIVYETFLSCYKLSMWHRCACVKFKSLLLLNVLITYWVIDCWYNNMICILCLPSTAQAPKEILGESTNHRGRALYGWNGGLQKTQR